MRYYLSYTIILLLIIIPVQSFAFSSGPGDGLAGDPPNRANCTQCHSSFGLNSGQGSLELADVPEEYEVGETYRLTIQLSDPNAERWGFELTAIDEDNDRAGNLEVVNGDQTQISDRNGRPQYLKHRSAGTFRRQQNEAQWEFDWTAPDEDIGEIWFYFTGNAANNNGNTAGDRIYAANVSMTAEEPPPPPPDEFELTLNEGWNLVSSIVTPDTAEIEFIFADVITDSSLGIIRNSVGDYYNPMSGEGELSTWESDEVYQVKMNQEATIVFSGAYVDTSMEYTLSEGWNWLPYTRQDESHPAEAFSEYAETIEVVKDNSGIFWSAGDELNYLSMIGPGSAVMVKASAETEFTWAVPAGEMDPPMEILPPEHFESPMNTGRNMSLLVTALENLEIAMGDEISIVNGDGEVFSSAEWQGETQPLIVWGDDDTTPEMIDGFMPDSSLQFIYYNAELGEEMAVYGVNEEGDSLTYSDGAFNRITLGIVVDGISDDNDAFRSSSFEIVSLYPNPFNQSSELEFRLIKDSHVKVSLWSTDGKLLRVLRNGYFYTGLHSVSVSARDFSAGMYFIGVQSGSSQKVKPIILLP